MNWTIASVIIAVAAVIVALRSFWFSKKIIMYQMFAEFQKEYRSFEMGIATRILWDTYEIKCNSNETKLIKEYINISIESLEGLK